MKYSKFSKRSIQSEMKQDARLQGKVRDRTRQGKDRDKMGTKQAQYRGFRGLTKFTGGWFYACSKPIYIGQDRLSGTLVYDSLHWFTLVSRDVELDNLVES